MPEADKQPPDATANDTSLVGRQIGKYEILRLVARGGMGTVYEAFHKGIGKHVALKIIDGELARSKDAVVRFQREAEAASAVDSAHIVAIFDSGSTEEGLPFIVMELLRGEDLGHRIKNAGRLEIVEALTLIAQLLRGLCRAHEAGIVHRDLKPDNVFLTSRDDETDFVKILDFGISKMRKPGSAVEKTITREGTVLGTPLYMSPEQAQAAPDIDERTDLWSVGAILYQCLTGRPPHEGHAYEAVIVNICSKDAADVRFLNPEVSEPLARFVAKALTRNRDERFQTAREMLSALREAAGELLPAGATKIGKPETAPRGAVSSSPHTPRPDGSGQTPLEVGPSGPSRVGWSTTGGAVVSKPRFRFAVLGVVAILGIALAFALTKRTPPATNNNTTIAASSPAISAPEITPSAAPTTTIAVDVASITAPSETTKTAPNKTTKTAPSGTAKKTDNKKDPGIAPQLKIKSE